MLRALAHRNFRLFFFGQGVSLFNGARLIGPALTGLAIAMLLLVTGCGIMVQMAACNTILQTIVDEDKRGRVMSLHAMAFMGTAPLGSLAAGALAGMIGALATVRIGGVACVLGGLLFFLQLERLREHIRPIYVRAGILPEIAEGMEAASELTAPRRG
ncbi:MAG TPA: MFS transporter [Pirellulales bacterium]|nr:MFS transporter [Pirellulales bacterium]